MIVPLFYLPVYSSDFLHQKNKFKLTVTNFKS
jgi:hypothetical protein